MKSLGIKNLTDLKDQNKLAALGSILLQAWENVLLQDSSINIKTLRVKPKEKELLAYSNKDWENLKTKNARTFNHYRNKFKMLVVTHGR